MHVLNFFCDNAIYLMKIKMRKQFKLKVCNVEYKIHTCIFTIEWYAYFSIFLSNDGKGMLPGDNTSLTFVGKNKMCCSF